MAHGVVLQVATECNKMQRRFPIDDIVLRSGDIHDQVATLREIAPKIRCFWPPIFLRRDPKCMTMAML